MHSDYGMKKNNVGIVSCKSIQQHLYFIALDFEMDTATVGILKDSPPQTKQNTQFTMQCEESGLQRQILCK